MSRNNNQINVPQAKEAMNRFKMECANEVGVNVDVDGHLVGEVEQGSVGGQMVNVMCPVRQAEYSRAKWDNREQIERVTYVYGIAV